jgi:hypothetical protein
MTLDDRVPFAAELSAPSPLAGEGPGGGCRTTRRVDLLSDDAHPFLSKARVHRTPFLRLLPSPTLPRKGGGSKKQRYPS